MRPESDDFPRGAPWNYQVLSIGVGRPRVFDQILVPPAVLSEMSRPRTPEPARLWATSPPGWLTVREPAQIDHSLKLGAGEKAAIALAQEVQAARILVDDRDAVRAARARGLNPVGTLALLDEAAERGLIADFPRTLERLTNDTNKNPAAWSVDFRDYVHYVIRTYKLRSHPGRDSGGLLADVLAPSPSRLRERLGRERSFDLLTPLFHRRVRLGQADARVGDREVLSEMLAVRGHQPAEVLAPVAKPLQ